ncbi:MAG: diguanylate cyclase, partial [Elusimicrobia bacterium]|nr:diguanylate cyclase [Elusimicrobiota bacterium]
LIIPLLVFHFLTKNNVRNRSYNDFSELVGNQLEHFEQNISSYLKLVEGNINSLIDNPLIHSASLASSLQNYPTKSDIYRLYEKFSSDHPEILAIYLGNQEGGYLHWPEGKINHPYDPRDQEWYILGTKVSSDSSRNNFYYSRRSEEEVLTMVKAIYSQSDELIGVLAVDLNLDFIKSLALRMDLGRSGYVIIADDDGNIIADSPNSKFDSPSLSELNLGLQNALEKPNKFISISLNGHPHIGVFLKSEQTGWNLVGLIEKSELFGISTAISVDMLWMIAIILVLIFILSATISRGFSKPIFSIIEHMKEIEKGNFSIKISDNICKRPDELGFLGRAVESMKNNIEKEIDKLKLLNKTGRILSSTLDWYRSIQSSADIIFEVAEADRGMILLAERDETDLEVYISRGLENLEIKDGRQYLNGKEIILAIDYEEVEKLKKEIYSNKKIKIYKRDESNLDTPKFISSWMEAIDASLVIPMVVKKRLVGFIILQAENSDINFIFTVSRQVGVAIENSRLYYTASTDRLTGLHIQRFFQVQLTRELKRSKRYGKPVSLMILDIDHFKKFNAKYGSQAADRLLKEIAEIISRNLREVDILCRYGSEELAIILPETNINQAQVAAEKIRVLIENESFLETYSVTVSIGLVQASLEDTVDGHAMVTEAERCLEKAKHQGRNRVVAGETPVTFKG